MIDRATHRAAGSRATAAILMLAVAGYWVPASSSAHADAPQATAGIHGVILSADGLTAVSGVTVKAANLETSKIYESARTGKDGAYELSSLPAGPYELAVETTPGSLYATDTTISAAAGRRTAVSLALRPEVRQEGEPPKEEPPKEEPPKQETPTEPAPDSAQKKKGTSFWRSAGGATILIVGGALVLGYGASALSSDNDDDDDDPMTGGGTGTTPN